MTETVETTEEEVAQVDDETPDEEVVEDPAAGLKKALASERKARRDAERQAREAAAALADRDKEPGEQAIEQAKREALEEARKGFNERLVRAELKAALSGKVRNASLALKVIDASEIDVSDEGEVDSQSVTDAIDALLKEYPDLAPDDNKFRGGADQGAGNKVARPSQLSAADVKNMSPQEIDKARHDGRLNDLLGIKS